ncbi:hypothetical protein CQW23_01266 [Capsicum baccatum]|uniref:Uncharacterized protein n=1 Tax=Capsicum baccatum TaxID=33114 RepID=A0A2G2XN33_CAPBA|nr:hypothetical protein CQW23_01266 [Capsicum baccatum]
MVKPSRGDKRKNDGRRKSITKRPLVEERSDDDSLEEESHPDVIRIEEKFTDTTSSCELESKVSIDEHNDNPNITTYREIESPAYDGEEPEPQRLVPQLFIEDEKQDKGEKKIESSSEKDCKVNDSETRKKTLDESTFLKFVVDSIINGDDYNKFIPPEEKKQDPIKETLSLIFLLEDEEPLPPKKQE